MGSTGASGDGIEFSIAPEQRVRDKVADEWSDTIAELRKSGRSDLAEEFAGLLPKTRGGFDIGDLSSLPSLAAASVTPNLSESISASQAFTGSTTPSRSLELEPRHMTLGAEFTPSHQQDHGFRAEIPMAGGFGRFDPIETARERVHQLRDLTPVMDEEGIQPSTKGGNIFAAPLQRIGTELGESAAAGETAGAMAAGESAAASGGFLGAVAGPLGMAATAIFTANQAGGLLHSALTGQAVGMGIADEFFSPGQNRHGSIKQLIDAAQTDAMDLDRPTGRFKEFIRHPIDRAHDMIFGPSPNHG